MLSLMICLFCRCKRCPPPSAGRSRHGTSVSAASLELHRSPCHSRVGFAENISSQLPCRSALGLRNTRSCQPELLFTLSHSRLCAPSTLHSYLILSPYPFVLSALHVPRQCDPSSKLHAISIDSYSSHLSSGPYCPRGRHCQPGGAHMFGSP